MIFKYLFGRWSKPKVSPLQSYDLRTLFEIKKHVGKCTRILQSVAVDAEAAKMTGIIALDQKGKEVEIVDTDNIYHGLLQLETMEYLIETRLTLIEMETKNPILIQEALFDLKMMVISLVIEFVNSDPQKIKYILVTILRIAIEYARPESIIAATAFRHNDLFCFYATASVETSVIKAATGPLSIEPIKKTAPPNLRDGIVLAERYAEMMGGRLVMSKNASGKQGDSIKFMAELSLYKS
jgi:hypothetical protein